MKVFLLGLPGSGKTTLGRRLAAALQLPFVDLDKEIEFRPGHLIVLAGRPSMGKSALAINFALHASCALRVPTLFTTLEMSETEIADRMLVSSVRIEGERVRDPKRLRPQERARIVETASELSQATFSIDFSPTRSLSDISATCRRQKRKKGGLGLLIVDYLQLVNPIDSRVVREQQVAQLSKGFKSLARELQIPIVLLAQLNRQVEGREDKRPRLSDLRESGSIEQDADTVLLVHREEYYLKEKTPEDLKGIAEVVIAKQRGGSTGIVKLAWNASWTRFDNVAKPGNYEHAFDSYNEEAGV